MAASAEWRKDQERLLEKGIVLAGYWKTNVCQQGRISKQIKE